MGDSTPFGKWGHVYWPETTTGTILILKALPFVQKCLYVFFPLVPPFPCIPVIGQSEQICLPYGYSDWFSLAGTNCSMRASVQISVYRYTQIDSRLQRPQHWRPDIVKLMRPSREIAAGGSGLSRLVINKIFTSERLRKRCLNLLSLLKNLGVYIYIFFEKACAQCSDPRSIPALTCRINATSDYKPKETNLRKRHDATPRFFGASQEAYFGHVYICATG